MKPAFRNFLMIAAALLVVVVGPCAYVLHLTRNRRPASEPAEHVSGSPCHQRAAGDDNNCWLGLFPHRIATFILPSDYGDEYDAVSRSWDVVEINDMKANYDQAWANGCRK